MAARRAAALQSVPLEECLLRRSRDRLSALSGTERISVAVRLLSGGHLSQRRVAELTGVSRDTLRRHTGQGGATSGSEKAQDGAIDHHEQETEMTGD